MNGQVASSTECPTPSAWHALWAGELTLDQLRALESHLDECAACAALIAITPPTPALLREAARDTTSHVDTPDIWYLRMRTSLLADSDGSPTIDMIEPEAPAGALPPSTIGDYELLERIGRGGMGIVFRARQVRLDRTVAVKTLHARTNQSPEAVERLIIEAKRLAQVRHPNIVQVIDVGEQDGVPFFSMELVEGTTVARAAREGPPWSPRRVAVLVAKIADAVHAAHEAGIVHRDLKPANVLLAAGDEPKITDFGLALTRADTEIGGPRLVAGTAEYMAPEQWAGDLDLITLRTDIYGLGTILYELLAGKPPFPCDRNPITTRQRVLNDNPAPLPAVPRDLEAICLRCLEKTPDRRYASAKDVADDLRRFLQQRPVAARPADMLTRLSYACRRNWKQLATVAAILLVSTALVVPYLISQAHGLQVGVANSTFGLGDNEARSGRINKALAYFDRALTELPSDQPIWRRFYEQSRARWAMLAPQDTKILENSATVSSSCVSPDGRLVLVGDATGGVALWSPSDGSARRLGQGAAKIHSTAFNRGGTRCAIGCEDGTVRVWDTVSGALITECRPDRYAIDGLAFLGDGNEFVTNVAASSAKLAIWSCGTSPATPISRGEKLDAGVSAIIPSPDGKSFLVLGSGGRCWLCDKSGQVKHDLIAAGQISAANFSPDGARIAVAGAAVQFFDPRTEQFGTRSPPIAGGSPRNVVVRPNGEVSVVIEDASRAFVRQYTPDLGSFDEIPIASLGATLAVDRDGETLLLTTGDPNQLRLARLPALGRRSIGIGDSGVLGGLSASTNGRWIATLILPSHKGHADRRFEIAQWDGVTLQQTSVIHNLPNGAFPSMIAQEPESALVAVACESAGDSRGEMLLLRPSPNGSYSVQLLGSHQKTVVVMELAPGGRRLYTGTGGSPGDRTAEIACWDTEAGVERGRVQHPAPIHALAVSPDRRWLAVGDADGTVTLLPADTMNSANAIRFAAGSMISRLAFSPDGAQLACGTAKGRVVILRPDDNRLTPSCEPITTGATVRALLYGVDPRLLFVGTSQHDAGVTAWNTDTGRAVGPTIPLAGTIQKLAAQAAGFAIFSLTTDGRLTMIPVRLTNVPP